MRKPDEKSRLCTAEIDRIISNQIMPEEQAISEMEHSLLELEGLGADIWQGEDTQDYVNRLRREWDD